MALFYFHTVKDTRDLDQAGTECANVNAARRAAIIYASTLIKDDPELLEDEQPFRVEIVTDQNIPLCTILMMLINAPNSADPEDILIQ